MSVLVKHRYQQVESVYDTISHGALSGEMVFIRNVALYADGLDGFSVYRLKNKVPQALLDHDPTAEVVENAICRDYLDEATHRGLDLSMSSIFPEHYIEDDFDKIELDASVWQPKLDVLTERFDALDLVNALDQELVDEFVAQLSAGGDAFALIDAKVLVETQRAQQAEGVVSSALAQEVTQHRCGTARC